MDGHEADSQQLAKAKAQAQAQAKAQAKAKARAATTTTYTTMPTLSQMQETEMTSELHLASKALELRKGKKSAATAVRPRKESLLYMGEDSDMDSSSESEEGDGSAPVGNRYLGGGGGAVGLFGGGRPRSVADSLRMLTEQAELHEMELQRLDAQINAVLHELVDKYGVKAMRLMLKLHAKDLKEAYYVFESQVIRGELTYNKAGIFFPGGMSVDLVAEKSQLSAQLIAKLVDFR